MNIQNYPVLLAKAKGVSLLVAQLQTFQIKRGKHKRLGETNNSVNLAIVWCLSVSWQTAGTIRQLQHAPTFWDKSFFCQTISCNCFLQNGLQLNSLKASEHITASCGNMVLYLSSSCEVLAKFCQHLHLIYGICKNTAGRYFFFSDRFFFPPSKITLLFNK